MILVPEKGQSSFRRKQKCRSPLLDFVWCVAARSRQIDISGSSLHRRLSTFLLVLSLANVSIGGRCPPRSSHQGARTTAFPGRNTRQGVQLDQRSQELQGHLHGPGQPRNQGRLGNRPKDNPIGSFFLSKVDADLLTYFIAGQIRNSTTSLVLQYFHRN